MLLKDRVNSAYVLCISVVKEVNETIEKSLGDVSP